MLGFYLWRCVNLCMFDIFPDLFLLLLKGIFVLLLAKWYANDIFFIFQLTKPQLQRTESSARWR